MGRPRFYFVPIRVSCTPLQAKKRRETTNMASSTARRSERVKPKRRQGGSNAVSVGKEANGDGAVGSDKEQVKEKEKSEVSSDDEETETEDDAAAKRKKKKKTTTQKSGKKNPKQKKTENKKKRKKESEEEELEDDDAAVVEEKKKSKAPAKKKYKQVHVWPRSSFSSLFSILSPGTRTKGGKGGSRLACCRLLLARPVQCPHA